MILYIIPIGLIGTGNTLCYFAWLKYNDLIRCLQREKIYEYPNDIKNILDFEKNPIIQIPHDKINHKYVYGEVKLNKIIKKRISIPVYKYKYSPLIDDYETIKENEYDYIDEKETIGKQILFPNVLNGIEIDNTLIPDKNIKVFLNNNLSTKSNNFSKIFYRYETLVKKNIPEYKTSIFNNNYKNMEIEENILEPYTDLYLLTNNYKNNLNHNKDKLYLTAFSDNKDKIIKLKYSKEIDTIEGLTILSISSIALGILGMIILGIQGDK